MNNENLIPDYDKSTWRHGEWDSEPDRMDFIHAGFSCLILRNDIGNWCGYVGVPKEHTCYGKGEEDFLVHGGITYTSKCKPPICHIPQEGMPDDVWWLGFDTAHLGDMSPCKSIHLFPGDTYKNMQYIINETKSLAEQLSEVTMDR